MLVFLTLAAPTAWADQTDTRLDDLFARLKATSDYTVAREIEATIWGIWSESDDAAVRILLANGMAAMSRQDFRGALEKFDQIVTIAPSYAEGWNKRATVNYLLGIYPASLADIAETLALEPRHFGALSGRGLVYAALDEVDLALESFEAALTIHPTLPGAALNAKALRKSLQDRAI